MNFPAAAVLGVVLTTALVGCAQFVESLENPDAPTADTAVVSVEPEPEVAAPADETYLTGFSPACDTLSPSGETLSTTRQSGRELTVSESLTATMTEWSLPTLGDERVNALSEVCPGIVLAVSNGGQTFLIDRESGAFTPSVLLERSGTIESIGQPGIESGGPSYGIRDVVVAGPTTFYSVGVVDEVDSCLRMEVRKVATEVLLVSRDDAVSTEIIYSSEPCVDFSDERREPAPLKIHLGGALAVDRFTDTLYLTIGDFHLGASRISQADAAGIEATELDYALLLDEGAALSAVVSIFQASTQPMAEVSSKGLRNSLGIVIDEAGGLWASDMGPGGGDEMNLITPGSDFGWPLTSPGQPYDRSEWPADPDDLPAPFLDFTDRDIPGTTPPIRQWTPAIAPSALSVIPTDNSPWGGLAGSLVLATLRDQSLHMLDHTDPSFPTLARISLDRRLRDMIVTSDGTIASVTDEATLVTVSPR